MYEYFKQPQDYIVYRQNHSTFVTKNQMISPNYRTKAIVLPINHEFSRKLSNQKAPHHARYQPRSLPSPANPIKESDQCE